MNYEVRLKKLSLDLYKIGRHDHAAKIDSLIKIIRSDRIVKEASNTLDNASTNWWELGRRILRRSLNFIPGIEHSNLSRLSEEDHKKISDAIRTAISNAISSKHFPQDLKSSLNDIKENASDRQIILFAVQNGLIGGYKDRDSEGFPLHSEYNTGSEYFLSDFRETPDGPRSNEAARVTFDGDIMQSGRVHPTSEILSQIDKGFGEGGSSITNLIGAGHRLSTMSADKLELENALRELPQDIRSNMIRLVNVLDDLGSSSKYHMPQTGETVSLRNAAVYYAAEYPDFFKVLINHYSKDGSFNPMAMSKELEDYLDKLNENPEAALRTVEEMTVMEEDDTSHSQQGDEPNPEPLPREVIQSDRDRNNRGRMLHQRMRLNSEYKNYKENIKYSARSDRMKKISKLLKEADVVDSIIKKAIAVKLLTFKKPKELEGYQKEQLDTLLDEADAHEEFSGYDLVKDKDSDTEKIYDSRRIVFLWDDDVVGFMTPREENRFGEGRWRTGAIFVDKEYRGMGIAQNAIEEFFRDKKGYAWISNKNISSQKAFYAAGFRKGEERNTGDSELDQGHNWYKN